MSTAGDMRCRRGDWIDGGAERSSVCCQRAVPARLQVADRVVEIDRLRSGGRVAGDRQQRFDRALQPVDLDECRCERGRSVGGLERLALELDTQCGERGAKLVRCVGRERALALDELADAL